jgi:hypothetical protein
VHPIPIDESGNWVWWYNHNINTGANANVTKLLIERLEICHGELFITCKPEREKLGWTYNNLNIKICNLEY